MSALHSTASLQDSVSWPGLPRNRFLPVVDALASIALGAAMLLLAGFLDSQTRAATERADQLKRELANSAGTSRMATPAKVQVLDVPPYYTHLSDVEKVLRIAEQHRVRLGTLNFRSEPVEKAGVILRVMEVRAEDEYFRMKVLIAEMLTQVPHLYLEEIRIDQAAESATKVQAALKLAFVYRAATPLQGSGSDKGRR